MWSAAVIQIGIETNGLVAPTALNSFWAIHPRRAALAMHLVHGRNSRGNPSTRPCPIQWVIPSLNPRGRSLSPRGNLLASQTPQPVFLALRTQVPTAPD